MPIENDNIETWGSDDMEPDTRTAAEIHSDELRERLRSDGFAVEVVRHDASGKETERFLSPQLCARVAAIATPRFRFSSLVNAGASLPRRSRRLALAACLACRLHSALRIATESNEVLA